nr:hypothetical protein [Lachnospiraceae bacterium]
YKIDTSNGGLRLRDKATGGDIIDDVPRNYTGYVISHDSHHALILYKGQLGYVSTPFLEIEKIDSEDYPVELLELSASDIGKELFDGKAIGEIEKSN